MAGKIDVKTLGHSGVIIDLNTLEPSVPDDSLVTAQNATHDPTLGYGGALRKRPGLKQFNLIAAGGPILGGIPMPVAGTGGAPATGGGGDTGSSDGGGDGTGAPGGTTDGADPSYPSPGAGAFTTPLFSGARLIIIGFGNNVANHDNGNGWYVSSKGLADAAVLVAAPGPAMEAGSTGMSFGGNNGYRPCLVLGGWLYYPGWYSEAGTATPTIRRTNGAVDQLVCSIPIYAATSNKGIVMSISEASETSFYVLVRDTAYNSAAPTGSLYLVSTVDFSLTVLAANTFVTVPYAGCTATNLRLFYIANPKYNGVTGVDAAGFATWDANFGISINDVHGRCLLEWQDRIWLGPATDGSLQHALYSVYKDVTNANKATTGPDGVLRSTSHAGGDLDTVYNAIKAVAFAGAMGMAVFNDELYISYYATGVGAYIVKLTQTGTPTAAAFTPTTVYSDTTAGRVPYQLYVDDGVLYAIGTLGLAGTAKVRTSVNGTVWTDHSATFFTNNVNQAFTIPIFFPLAQS